MKNSALIIVTVIFALQSSSLLAQSDRIAGKIRGKIYRSDTKEPLSGADVVLLPISLGRGATADEYGEFVIPNIPVGDYDIKATYIGFSSFLIKGVRILPGQTIEFNFPMTVQALAGEEVNVIAEARESIVTVKTTNTQRKISGEEITRMPVTDFQDVLANTGGVTETEGGRSRGIHIRGGRSGEIAYFVDGIQTNDPVDRSQGIEIDNEAIEDIVISTGGFSAEFGEAMSGVVTIVTKSGQKDNFSSSLIYETDQIFRRNSLLNNGYEKYNLGLGGPVIGLKDVMSFYISGSFISGDIRNPRTMKLNHSEFELPQGTFKLLYSPKRSSINITLAGSFSNEKRQNYLHMNSKGDWLRDYYTTLNGHNRISLQFQNMVGNNTAWRLMLWYHEPYYEFGSGNNQSYKKFRYISTRLDWLDYAVSNEWYDPRTREWTPITDEDGLPLISDEYSVYDEIAGSSGSAPVPLASLPPEFQAFYYYYFKEAGTFDIARGEWTNESDRVNAFNQRWHEAGFWYIPALLDEESVFHTPNDSTANYKEFDDKEYAEYLLNDEEFKRTHDLWSYNGNMHNGWYWDRDLFNVYTYGPGRPRSHYQRSIHRGLEFHLSSQWSLRNEAKVGFMLKSSDMDFRDIQFANQNPYFDSYHYQPISAAAWLENKYEFEDFVAMTGLRWDYFQPQADAIDNTDVFDVDGDGEVDRSPATVKSQVSPRLGVNFSASEKTAIFMNYGYFFQVPEYGEIYQNIYADLTSGLPLIGNPDIKPEKTVQYQFGMVHKFSERIGLEVNAFYKDVLNLLATRTNTVLFNGVVATVTTQEMEDYAKIKGVDCKLKFNQFHNLSGEITYSYLSAKGTGSSNREFYYLYIYESDRPLPSKEYPLEFDVTHSLKMNINYYIPPVKKDLRGILIGNWNLNLQANFATGAPYTPEDTYGKPQELGSRRMPTTKRIDLRIEKYLPFFSVYLDIRNLFNWENIVYVYPYSGQPDTNGRPPVFERSRYLRYIGERDPESGYVFRSAEEAYEAHLSLWKSRYDNPYNYSSPQIIRLGLSIRL